MRVLAVISAFFALLLAANPALSQTCNRPASCPTNPAQVPLPYYSLTFDTPLSSKTWGYNSTDPDGCGHTGLAITGSPPGDSNGNALSFIDLNSTSNAQSAGIALPPIGISTSGGSLSTFNKGWTFEVTVKPLAQTSWAKIFCLGNGAGVGTVLIGYNGGNRQFDFTVNTADGRSNSITGVSGGTITQVPNPNVVMNQWYHLAVTVQQVDALGLVANWFAYVNGVLVNGSATTQINVPDGSRPLSYIGRSCWGADALFQQEVDAFRVYNQALNADQVNSLYAQQMGQCNITMTANPTLTSSYPNSISTATTAVTPIWGLNFTTNPSSAVGTGVTPSYNWQDADSGDVSCGLNQKHQGMVVLQGGPSPSEPFPDLSFLNLSATTGPTSVGNPPLPILGGATFSSGSLASQTAGMTFEITFKPGMQATWGKLFDIGGFRAPTDVNRCNGDLVFGWRDNSMIYMNLEVCQADGNSKSMGQWGPFMSGNWYHVVITMQQLGNGNANLFAYTNGRVLSVSSNVPFPQAQMRQLANIGKSNWNDAMWSGWIDTFNIYNVAVSPAQVANMYTAAMGASPVVTACPFAPSNTSVIPASALYYDLSFPTNPNVPNQAYQWLAFDPTDATADQSVHRGLVNISGCLAGNCNGTFINMAATSGPNSAGAGKALGTIGGVGTGSISDSSVGWSIEVTFKAQSRQTWAKMFDIGDGVGSGSGVWEIFFGWHNTDPFYNLGVIFATTQDYSSAAALAMDNLSPATPNVTVGQWTHCVVVMQYDWARSQTDLGSLRYNGGMQWATYTVYTNGVMTGNSTGNLFPARVQRINAMLGKSNYGDTYWQGLIDTFRVYSIALNANQARSLYTASSQPPVTASSSTGAGVSSGSSSAAASSGAGGVSAGSSSAAASSGAASSSGAIAVRSSSSSVSAAVSAMASSSSAAATSAPLSQSSSAQAQSSSPVAQSSTAVGPSSAPVVQSSAPVAPSSSTAAPTAVPSVTSASTASPTGDNSVTSATSDFNPPVTANGAVQSVHNLIAVVLSIIAVLALVM